MGELNPYEKDSNLRLKADFYVVKISKKIQLISNDLPALIEIPIDKFVRINLNTDFPLPSIKNYITKTKKEIQIPENCAIMVPNEVKEFFTSKF